MPALFAACAAAPPSAWSQGGAPAAHGPQPASRAGAVSYRSVQVDGVRVFYREAGPKDAPVILLLHGFPSSSHMFRDLIPLLADRYRLVAPDYPGFGQSDMPPPDAFTYTFDNLARVMGRFTEVLGLARYALYVQDYGAPVGYRLASARPERVSAIVAQNGNAYEEGIAHDFWLGARAFWADGSEANAAKIRPILEAESTRWQYQEGARDPSRLSPDAWTLDQAYLERPGNKAIQMALLRNYGSNPPLYPVWQDYFRKHQPPMLVVWGKNDKIFPPAGAHPYLRDLPKAELHLLDTGHFALEEDSAAIAALMRGFLARHLRPSR
jgi:pimeloyl-ACP methyl ester carboxylesterase